MLTEPDIFPDLDPPWYERLAAEPAFDPTTDLALTGPDTVESLRDFRYDERFTAAYPSEMAITSPVRILSETGSAKLRSIVEQLREYAIWADSASAPGIIRGAAYRSRFVRDLCLSPEVTAFVSNTVDAQVAPTALSHQLAHINVPPRDGSGLVGAWHVDQNSYVLVLALHEPEESAAGRFQYYRGPRGEALRLLEQHGDLDEERVVSVPFPGPGWGILMQGSAIVHRAEPLTRPADRITVVTSYEPTDVTFPDQNPQWLVQTGYENDPNGANEERSRALELARHKAWRTRGHLDDFIRRTPWETSNEEIVKRLSECVRDVLQACNAIQRGAVDPVAALHAFAISEQAEETHAT